MNHCETLRCCNDVQYNASEPTQSMLMLSQPNCHIFEIPRRILIHGQLFEPANHTTGRHGFDRMMGQGPDFSDGTEVHYINVALNKVKEYLPYESSKLLYGMASVPVDNVAGSSLVGSEMTRKNKGGS